jgi:hypothetical protein
MAKFECELRAKASEVAKYLNSGIQQSTGGVELIDSSAYRVGTANAYFLVYDRSSCRATLSILVIGSEDGDCTVSAISSEGGNTSLANISRNSEYDFVTIVERLMDSYSRKRAGD